MRRRKATLLHQKPESLSHFLFILSPLSIRVYALWNLPAGVRMPLGVDLLDASRPLNLPGFFVSPGRAVGKHYADHLV